MIKKKNLHFLLRKSKAKQKLRIRFNMLPTALLQVFLIVSYKGGENESVLTVHIKAINLFVHPRSKRASLTFPHGNNSHDRLT